MKKPKKRKEPRRRRPPEGMEGLFKPLGGGQRAAGRRSFTGGALGAKSARAVRAIIFDLDGVLADSERQHIESFRRVFAKYGVKITLSHWMQNYVGRGSEHIVKDLVGRYHIHESEHRLLTLRQAEFLRIVKEESMNPVAGALEIVKWARRNGLKMIVASSGHRSHVRMQLKMLGLGGLRFVSGDDVRLKKPNPQAFLLAAKRLGVAARHCIVIEDSKFGAMAARRARMACVLIGMHHDAAARRLASVWARGLRTRRVLEYLILAAQPVPTMTVRQRRRR